MPRRYSLALLPVLATAAYWVWAPNLAVSVSASQFDRRRALELLVLFILTVATAASPRIRKNTARMAAHAGSTVSGCLLVAAAGGAAASVLSAYPAEAFADWTIAAGCVFAVLVVAGSFAAVPATARLIISVALATSAALCLITLCANLTAAAAVEPTWIDVHNHFGKTIFAGYTNPRFFGQWQTWTLPLLVMLTAPTVTRNVAARWFAHVLVIGYWAAVLAGGTRGTLVAIFIGIVVVAIVERRRSGSWVLRHAGLAAVGTLAFLLLRSALPEIFAPGVDVFQRSLSATDSGRFAAWSAAWALIRESPFVGVGPQHYGSATQLPFAHPHNLVLRLASEWGVPATLAVCFVIARGFVAALRPLPSATDHSRLEQRWALNAYM